VNGLRTVKLVQASGRIAEPYAILQRAGAQLDDATFEAIYYPRKLLLRATSHARLLPPGPRETLLVAHAAEGVKESVWLLAYPAPNMVLQIAVPLGEASRLPTATRDVLHRFRIHAETALRLQLREAQSTVAILDASGKLLHAEGDARSNESRHELEARVQRIEQARSRAGRAQQRAALAAWEALVEGRWSLVEDIQQDGRKHYLALQNEPQTRSYRSLTPRETRVLFLSSMGLSGKHLAYELGLSETHVAACLGGAATKIGVRNRTELCRVVAGLLAGEPDRAQPLPEGLSDAELAVLELVAQGLSNREIATRRGSSERTVANQVASILRKTKRTSRRGAACLVLSKPP
jgi:DNA-binding NarL/FixJ family response regulator